MRGIAVVVVVVVKVVVAASGIDDAFSATVQLVRGIFLRIKVSGPRFGSSGERGEIRGNYTQNSLMRRRRYSLHLDVGSFFLVSVVVVWLWSGIAARGPRGEARAMIRCRGQSRTGKSVQGSISWDASSDAGRADAGCLVHVQVRYQGCAGR